MKSPADIQLALGETLHASPVVVFSLQGASARLVDLRSSRASFYDLDPSARISSIPLKTVSFKMGRVHTRSRPISESWCKALGTDYLAGSTGDCISSAPAGLRVNGVDLEVVMPLVVLAAIMALTTDSSTDCTVARSSGFMSSFEPWLFASLSLPPRSSWPWRSTKMSPGCHRVAAHVPNRAERAVPAA